MKLNNIVINIYFRDNYDDEKITLLYDVFCEDVKKTI